MRVLAALLLLVVLAPARAGQTCGDKPLDAQATVKAIELATQVQDWLDTRDATAAILARVGSDISKYGLRYTHAGLVYRSGPDAGWTVLHKLNQCGSATATLFRQGLGNFFLDDPHEYRALILLPSASLQNKLVTVATGDAGRSMDEPRYSLLAYPFALEFQNSNGWLLETSVRALANYPVLGRAQAQDYLRRTGYRPDTVEVTPLDRLGATLFRTNIAFFDHPRRDRLRGRYAIVSVESIARYLGERAGLLSSTELALE